MSLGKKRVLVTLAGAPLKIHSVGKSAILSEIINQYISKNKKDFARLLRSYIFDEDELEEFLIELGVKEASDKSKSNKVKPNDHSKRVFVPLRL